MSVIVRTVPRNTAAIEEEDSTLQRTLHRTEPFGRLSTLRPTAGPGYRLPRFDDRERAECASHWT